MLSADELLAIGKQRYNAYAGTLPQRHVAHEQKLMLDSYDFAPNVEHFTVKREGQIVASIRLHTSDNKLPLTDTYPHQPHALSAELSRLCTAPASQVVRAQWLRDLLAAVFTELRQSGLSYVYVTAGAPLAVIYKALGGFEFVPNVKSASILNSNCFLMYAQLDTTHVSKRIKKWVGVDLERK